MYTFKYLSSRRSHLTFIIFYIKTYREIHKLNKIDILFILKKLDRGIINVSFTNETKVYVIFPLCVVDYKVTVKSLKTTLTLSLMKLKSLYYIKELNDKEKLGVTMEDVLRRVIVITVL